MGQNCEFRYRTQRRVRVKHRVLARLFSRGRSVLKLILMCATILSSMAEAYVHGQVFDFEELIK